ncbi:retrovirus-related pol polyprotein from transposon TNT 1-94 [Tanacetum coccineum]
MHNNIMAAGSMDRPPMLATGRYAQWQSHFLRYINTRPNGDALWKCILKGSYQLTTVTILVVPATDDSPAVPERTVVKTLLNMSSENKEHYQSEKKAIHLLLTGIGDEIYITVDACKTAHDMWIAIERLQQGESLNIQDVKTNLFWEFGKFTSHDGDSMESYYSGFYKMMNEMIRNNLTVSTMQYQKEVNEIRAERIVKNANLLALVAVAQQYPDPYYQAPKSHKSYEPPSKQSSSTRSHAPTKYKCKEIAKPITPPSESALEEEMTVAGARETVGSQVVQQTGIHCFNCKEFSHFSKECRKPKRVKDYTYHKEKMLLCKQAEKGVPLQAEQADWLADTNEQIDDQEFEAHYIYMEKIQEVPTTDSKTNTEPLEQIKDIVIGLPKLKYVKDQLCSSCELSKAKRSSFKTKVVPSSKGRLNLFHMDLCGPMRVESINGKKYILMIQRNLQAQLITIRTDKGTEFLKKTLHAYFKEEGIKHQTSTPPTPEQNDIGENLDKIKEKGDPCILAGYSTQSKGYKVYNKRTRLIVESIHLRFDEIKEMSETSVANNTSGLVLQ